MKRCTAIVDLSAIGRNLGRVREVVGPAVGVMAVVKADAYGHGMGPVARTARAAGAEWLGVALPSEALALRAHGDQGPVLAWLWTPGDPSIPSCIRESVSLSVSSVWAVEEVAATARQLGRVARVHIKVDTGLSRNGATAEQLPQVLDAVAAALAQGSVEVEGIWSHLAEGEVPGAPSVAIQLQAFHDAVESAAARSIHPRLRHLANSGGAFAHPDTHFDLVRTGIAMYGLTPGTSLGTARDLGLTPAMTLVSRLAHVKGVAEGTGVSYGWTWTASRETALGLLPLGYADGIPRAVGDHVSVTIGGRPFPIIGRVAMDQCVIDLGVDDLPHVGDEIHLFGPGEHGESTADDWADAIGTVGYEIVTRLGPRVPREYAGVGS